MRYNIIVQRLGMSVIAYGMAFTAHAAVSPATPAPPKGVSPQLAATVLKAPLSFEANHGQVDGQVKFISRGSGYTLFLTPTESVMVLQQRQANETQTHDPLAAMEPAPIKQSVVRMKLEGANPEPTVEGLEQLPGIVNYFIGNDPAKWRTKIPTYAKVHYKDAYPGIDLAYYGNQGKLEYDFIVSPGADPNQIQLAFDGASDIRIADSGDLVLTTALGEVKVQKPIVYQLEKDGHKTLLAGNYIASSKVPNAVGIQLAAYDRSKSLVIDPVLLYSTYLGGSAAEAGIEFGTHGIAVDSAGNAYIAGATASTDFPGVNAGSVQPVYGGGSFDAYVVKLSPAGSSILWATYLGGVSYDRAAAIALDQAGNAYVTGFTNSTTLTSATFPTTAGAYRTFGSPSDAFITKISSDGATLIYSTLLGSNGDRDIAWSIAVDTTGAAYVAGETRTGGAVFPTTSGAFQTTSGGTAIYLESSDAFVTKLNPSGTGLMYSTLLGGSANDSAFGIVLDSAANAYVVGNTRSSDFPGVNSNSIQQAYGGNLDAFIVKLNATGTALEYSSYLGGSGEDWGRAIALDSTGNAYVTGQTFSADFPLTPGVFQNTIGNPDSPAQYDAYVSKIGPSGTLTYSTYLGGTNYDAGFSIKVDGSGNAHVVGRGRSTNFPGIVSLTGSPVTTPFTYAFYSKINPTASAIAFSVYLGGNIARPGTNGETVPFGLALDAQANAYITGWTRAANFPLVSAADSTAGGDIDDFVMKIRDEQSDSDGPPTSQVQANPNPASVSQAIIVSATIDDTTTGGSTIARAAYEVRNGAAVAYGGNSDGCSVPLTGSICPTTTGFDQVTENVAASIPAGTLSPAVYDLCVQGTDANGNIGTFECAYLVVYDPSGKFVTGGGWIQSNPGFCTLTQVCEAASGKAHFGFVSKYKKGATVPSGETQFEFRAGGLTFHSTVYEWLVVAGPLAQFKGFGTINGLGDYGFLLTAQDSAIAGGPTTDTFRIKIWDKGTGLTVYDNGTDQPIGGGSIVIH